MKFWLKRETDSIFLDQFFKATGWGTDYQEIRREIEAGKVRVNDTTVFNRRTQLREGDQVRYRGLHVIIAGKKMADVEQIRRSTEGNEEHVVHNRKPIHWKQGKIKETEKKK